MAAYGVKTNHNSYDAYAMKWRRVRDVLSGQDAIYAGTTLYLPKLAEESDADYLVRLKRTPFYNASWRTVAAFVGMMFRKAPTIEVPDKLKPMLDDVTMSGVSFENFAQDVTLEDLSISRVGVLVDYPNGATVNADGTPITMAQAEAAGLRPSMVMYKAECIKNWRHEWINNKKTLTQVRLWEQASERKSEFEEITYGVIRVLDLFNGKYRVRRFKEENEEQIGWDIYPTMNGQPMTEIPFYFIGPDGAETDVTDPILIDLFDLNLKHFGVSADYEHGCHMTGLPTPVITGAQPSHHDANGIPVWDKLYIGSMSAWMLPLGADAKFLSLENGMEALEKNLDRKEAQMAAIGARMLTPEKAGVEAEGTLAMRHSGEHSILAAVANAVSDGLTKALKTFALWAGCSEAEIKKLLFAINRDFMPFAITPQALTALLGAVQAGKMSHEAFFDLMKRGDLYESDLTFEDEQARTDEPALPAPIAPGQQPGQPPKPQDKPADKE